jgi:predicted MFS family arabinose efflux permease
MAQITSSFDTPMARHSSGALLRTFVIGLTAFLTLVDLFATQAILPSLAQAYGVTPAAMSFAVNASTFGMAIASLGVALLSRRIDRRWGILLSLAALSIPTALLASAPNLGVFTFLRVAQGICMASAFTLTLAYLGEQCSADDAATAFAGYIAGNVGSNFIGRLMSAAVADHFGLAPNFYFFAVLNLAGACMVYFTIARAETMPHTAQHHKSAFFGWTTHLRNGPLCAAFAIGFCILFAFIGTFTYVNFVLVREPLSLGRMQLGFIYFVFVPSIVTTLLAGRITTIFGTRTTMWGALALAGIGLQLLLSANLSVVLAGMVFVAVGTFMAQALATGFVGKAATSDHGSASGIYLACYFLGGLVGTAVLGQVFDRVGWAATVAVIAASLLTAAVLTILLRNAASRGALTRPTQSGEHLVDVHPLAIVRIDEARLHETISANHERGGDREHPGIVALKARKISAPFAQHPLHFGADPDDEIE